MFPMISKKHSENSKYISIFLFSLLVTLLFCFIVLTLYYFFPAFSISLLFGNPYLAVKNLLFEYALFIVVFSVCSLFLSFFLSIGRTWVASLSFLVAVLQIVGIWIFHKDLSTVITVSLFSETGLAAALICYFIWVVLGNEKKFVH